ncbi:universal stress protein [Thermodesulfobacteriota bacterium]
MKKQRKKKLLLALDGSESAMDAVKYVSKFPPFHKMDAVLFNVFSKVPESYLDLQRDPRNYRWTQEVRAWEVQQKKMINEFMQEAKQTLIRSGFPQDSITVVVQNRKKGIARDIIREAKNGYSMIIIGRKGLGTFKSIIIGSVANKIVNKASFLPVLLIGKIPPDENILLAIDPSEGAMRTVDFVAETLGGFDFRIHLLHVIRGMSNSQAGFRHLFLPQDSMEGIEKEMDAVFDAAKQRLINAGFKPDQTTTKIISGAHSRAGSIIQEVRDQDFGTIVIGRRGLSKVQEFFMGRVSNKLIQTVRNRAVWVVT